MKQKTEPTRPLRRRRRPLSLLVYLSTVTLAAIFSTFHSCVCVVCPVSSMEEKNLYPSFATLLFSCPYSLLFFFGSRDHKDKERVSGGYDACICLCLCVGTPSFLHGINSTRLTQENTHKERERCSGSELS